MSGAGTGRAWEPAAEFQTLPRVTAERALLQAYRGSGTPDKPTLASTLLVARLVAGEALERCEQPASDLAADKVQAVLTAVVRLSLEMTIIEEQAGLLEIDRDTPISDLTLNNRDHWRDGAELTLGLLKSLSKHCADLKAAQAAITAIMPTAGLEVGGYQYSTCAYDEIVSTAFSAALWLESFYEAGVPRALTEGSK